MVLREGGGCVVALWEGRRYSATKDVTMFVTVEAKNPKSAIPSLPVQFSICLGFTGAAVQVMATGEGNTIVVCPRLLGQKHDAHKFDRAPHAYPQEREWNRVGGIIELIEMSAVAKRYMKEGECVRTSKAVRVRYRRQ